MQLTSCLQRCRIWWSDCWTTSRSSIARSANSKRRSRRGIAAASSARSLRRYPVSDPWAPAPWWPPSLTPGASPTGGKCRRGSDWCRDSIPAAANRPNWGSVSGVTFIYARCSFMGRVRRLLPRSAERASIHGWPVCCIGVIRTSQRSRWRTRTPAPCGRYLPTTGSSGPTTSLRWQRSRVSAANATKHRRSSTDCSGDHAVMA
jgi:hypothetical protein